ncbi:MFS transporter, sucrose transport protein [Rhodotorula toruloides]|uniref:MFS transporter, sucrose transport protein n=1 Tax=Rhodotorula toruloides TaxID=5286 RepID=A0A511KRP1_RHOTO|nr:MFS transporter, sucrose transport protein [Rhodotorula toruloides]
MPSSPRTPPVPSTPPGRPHTTYQSFADLSPSSHPHANGSPGTRSKPQRSLRTLGRGAAGEEGRDERPPEGKDGVGKSELDESEWTTWRLNTLTVGILGAQLAWTVEMAYGTPYLLGLGLSKEATSLVWMAGPLSGLIVQPVVGALSDSSPGRFRRRFYILLSTLLIIFSTVLIAYARELASLLCSSSIFGGVGDWDPQRQERERMVAITAGVLGFYVLDFSLNGLQASLRALALDLSPLALQSISTAWLGRHTHIGNIHGYLFGFLDLGHSPVLSWLGEGQFRKLSAISLVVLGATVGVTCWYSEERERKGEDEGGKEGVWSKVMCVVRDVRDNVRKLPMPVRRVCYVQFFAWTGWFPFLFYSTTYVSETLYASLPPSTPLPSSDSATRLGSLALLLYALVSLLAGTVLPFLTSLCTTYPSLPSRLPRWARVALSTLNPRACWVAGLVWFAVVMEGTFFVRGTKGAMAVVALAGVPWAINCWVPFALVMECIRGLEDSPPASPTSSPAPTPPPSSPTHASPRATPRLRDRPPFRATTLRHPSYHGLPSSSPHRAPSSPSHPSQHEPTDRTPLLSHAVDSEQPRRKQPAGGTILGLHNLSIVVPQFFDKDKGRDRV